MKTRRYAERTRVTVGSSRAEIENTVRRYGATGFMSMWQENQAQIGFLMHSRNIRFVLSLPSDHESQAARQRWRALALVVKAKLEAVASGIAEFESEFMANIVMPDGRTVAEHALPAIAEAYRSGSVQNLLPDYSGAP